MTSVQSAKAQDFHALHHDGILIIANAWDAGSARLIEDLGARAVATTSAGVAWAHGYGDGDRLPVSLLAATVSGIVRWLRVPLSVDMEGGYSSDPVAVGEAVGAIVDAGGVGINIEDGQEPPDALCAKIEAAKEAGIRHGVDLFVNARTDVYLRRLVPGENLVTETLNRAQHYRSAGADGFFVPGLTDPAAIRAVASAVALPLNVMARPGLAGAKELAQLGVRRLTSGSSIAEAVYGRVAALASSFLRDGNSDALVEGSMSYPAINKLMD